MHYHCQLSCRRFFRAINENYRLPLAVEKTRNPRERDKDFKNIVAPRVKRTGTHAHTHIPIQKKKNRQRTKERRSEKGEEGFLKITSSVRLLEKSRASCVRL